MRRRAYHPAATTPVRCFEHLIRYRRPPALHSLANRLDIDARIMGALGIGVFMGALDLTIVAPALSHISGSLGVSPSAVVLAFSIYAAFYAVSVPLMSRLSDSRGYKKIYMVSLLLFSAGSAAAAFAPSLPALVAARIVQGVGGGGLFPVAQAIVGITLPARLQDRALAILMAVFAVGAVLGPNLGGFLVQTLSWHWIFWINVPLGLIAAMLLVGQSVPSGSGSRRIDWAGAALVALALGSFVLGLERLRHLGETGFFTMNVGGVFLLTAIGVAGLVVVERRQADPILDLNLMASPIVAPLLAISLLVGYTLLGTVVFIPFYAQLAFGASALGGGAVLNAAAVGLGVASYVSARYTRRVGEARLVQAGMAAMAIGQALLIALHAHLWAILGGLMLLGIGLGITQGPISALSLALAPRDQQGQISGLVAITRSLGGATGITLAGVLLHHRARGLVERLSADAASLSSAAWGSIDGLQALRDAPAGTRRTVQDALTTGLIDGWYVALAASAVGFLLALLLRRKRRHEPKR